jgi:hypothetical protein
MRQQPALSALELLAGRVLDAGKGIDADGS